MTVKGEIVYEVLGPGLRRHISRMMSKLRALLRGGVGGQAEHCRHKMEALVMALDRRSGVNDGTDGLDQEISFLQT